jgi:hypothetical protein
VLDGDQGLGVGVGPRRGRSRRSSRRPRLTSGCQTTSLASRTVDVDGPSTNIVFPEITPIHQGPQWLSTNHRSPRGLPAGSCRVDQQRSESSHPPVGDHVVDLDPALGQQLFNVTVGRAIARVPADHHDDHVRRNASAQPALPELTIRQRHRAALRPCGQRGRKFPELLSPGCIRTAYGSLAGKLLRVLRSIERTHLIVHHVTIWRIWLRESEATMSIIAVVAAGFALLWLMKSIITTAHSAMYVVDTISKWGSDSPQP